MPDGTVEKEIRVVEQETLEGYVEEIEGDVVSAVFVDARGSRCSSRFPLDVLPEEERKDLKLGTHLRMVLSPDRVEVRRAVVSKKAPGESDGEKLAALLRGFRTTDPETAAIAAYLRRCAG